MPEVRFLLRTWSECGRWETEQRPGLGDGDGGRVQFRSEAEGGSHTSRADSSPTSCHNPLGDPRTFFQGDPGVGLLWLLLIYFPIYINGLLGATSNDYRCEPSEQAKGQVKVVSG